MKYISKHSTQEKYFFFFLLVLPYIHFGRLTSSNRGTFVSLCFTFLKLGPNIFQNKLIEICVLRDVKHEGEAV